MKDKKEGMNTKLEITVEKTMEAIDRIERFVTKYSPDLNNNQVDRISRRLQELLKKVNSLG